MRSVALKVMTGLILAVLKLTNDLLTQEIATGQTIYSGFGAGYEILYRRDVRVFERIDDVMRLFAQVKVNDEGVLTIGFYPHVTRQWYEEDRLYIASMAYIDAAEEGFGAKGYIVTGVLGEELPPDAQKRC